MTGAPVCSFPADLLPVKFDHAAAQAVIDASRHAAEVVRSARTVRNRDVEVACADWVGRQRNQFNTLDSSAESLALSLLAALDNAADNMSRLVSTVQAVDARRAADLADYQNRQSTSTGRH